MEMKVCTIGRETISLGGEKVFMYHRKRGSLYRYRYEYVL
jgi:hypothetical protein